MSPKSNPPKKAKAAVAAAPAKKKAPAKAGKAEMRAESEVSLDADGQLDPIASAEQAEEAEENEEATRAAASNAGGGNAAALAAASGPSEMSASFKNFRHHPDMENFYRFIFENDLRHEALAIIDGVIADKAEKRLAKAAKA